MPSAPHGASGPQKVPRSRVVSWKEIADYLDKGERTVKRWATERALPVHHVPGGGHGSVYALTEELDQWLISERTKGPVPVREESPEAPPSFEVVEIPGARSPQNEPRNSFVARWSRGWKRRSALGVVVILSVLLASRFLLPDITRTSTSLLRTASAHKAGIWHRNARSGQANCT